MKVRTLGMPMFLIGWFFHTTCAAEPSPLGRLFFSPEARASLERQRQSAPLATGQTPSEHLRVDGVVIGSSGTSTVWLNQQAQTPRERGASVTAVPSQHHPGRVKLSSGTQKPIEVKVGATIDLSTSTTDDGLARGQIQIRK